MKRRVFSVCLLMALMIASPAYCKKTKIYTAEIKGWHQSSLQQRDQVRHYRYFVPVPAEQASEALPMVVLLHGGTQSMSKLFRKHSGASQSWSGLAQQENFVLMVPNGTNIKTQDTAGDDQHWNDCRPFLKGTGAGSSADDVGFILQLITWAIENLGVDARRIYVTGASNGGMMSYRLAQEAHPKIAAVAAFVANLPEPSECAESSAPMPMMIVNGTLDTLMPWQGGAVTGGAGRVLSSEQTVAHWLTVNGLEGIEPTVSNIPDSSSRDKSHIIHYTYESDSGVPLYYYIVEGGGHTIPSPHHEIPGWLQGLLLGRQNRDFDAVAAAWEFMEQHRLNFPASVDTGSMPKIELSPKIESTSQTESAR